MKPRTPDSPLQRLVPALVMSVGALLLVGVFLSLVHPETVQANTGDMNSVVAKYPQINGSRLDSCSLCHTSSIPSLNSYGAAYKAAGRTSAAYAAIEALDSDKDGFTNLQEINALTFPGDASDHPMMMPTATMMPRPTNTPTRVPPTSTPTRVPPTNTPTHVPPTSTSIPTTPPTLPPATNTPLPTVAPTQPGTQAPTATLAAPSSTPTSAPSPVPSTTATTVPSPTPGTTPTTVPSPAPGTTPTTVPSPAPSPSPTQPAQKPGSNRLKVTAAADAYVSAQQASQNFGAEQVLMVTANPQARSYLSFSVPDQTNARSLNRAVLSLYVERSSRSGFVVQRVDGSAWSESQITFDSAPKPGSQVGASGNHVSAGHWINIDVTSLLKGSGAYSLALVARGSGSTTIASRESGAHAPTLTLSFRGRSGGHGDNRQGNGGDGDD